MDAYGHVWAPLCTRHTFVHVISMCKNILYQAHVCAFTCTQQYLLYTRHTSMNAHVLVWTPLYMRHTSVCSCAGVSTFVYQAHISACACLCANTFVYQAHVCMHTHVCVCMLAPLCTWHISMHAHVLLWTFPCTRHTSMHISLPIRTPMCAKCLYMQQPPNLPLRVILLFFPFLDEQKEESKPPWLRSLSCSEEPNTSLSKHLSPSTWAPV